MSQKQNLTANEAATVVAEQTAKVVNASATLAANVLENTDRLVSGVLSDAFAVAREFRGIGLRLLKAFTPEEKKPVEEKE